MFEFPEDLAADLLPFLPKFHHALLDLTRYDPEQGEDISDLQPIFQLMKFARMKQVLRYFEWHAGATNVKISKILLGRFLLYALHADSDLDVEQIYRSLTSNPELQKSTMSVAEKLLAKGRSEGLERGLEKGYWLGRIQSLEEFLKETKSPRETLELMTVTELEARHQQLQGEYQRRFK